MTFDYKAARLTMVESQVRTSDVTDLHVQDAMRIAPREALCPADKKAIAYADAEIEYAPGLYLLRPRAVGKLLQALRPTPGERGLAIAAPYAALVMREIGLKVDEIPADGAPAPGAYDVVIAEGAVSAVPQAWRGALAPGGRLAAIVREGPAAASVLPGFEPKPQFAF
jgi:protein-L-isoaspartate(D-aspartate) O-methyltransferase